MTDNEIIRALFILRHGSAEGEHNYFEAIEIIENEYNRQKAEIEEYRAKYKDLYTKLSNVTTMAITVNEQADEIKADAYKEFAERLKEEKSKFIVGGNFVDIVHIRKIDNLLTELTERKEGAGK